MLGERNSGKTAFCKHMGERLFSREKVHHIFPPKAGSSSPEDLARGLEKATGFEGSVEEIVQALPQDTVVVLHDLEAWFERRSDGFSVIRIIAKLMDDYGDKILFVINTNPYSFDLIQAVEPMEHRFLSVIELAPFSAEELKDLILRRHQSSGMQFRWKNREEFQLSELRKAGLFDSYFACSEGNPGVALNSWLDNIERVTGKVVNIRTPVIPGLTALRGLDDDWLALLAQFVLHKRMTTERLSLITGLEMPEIKKTLRLMRSSGLVEERGERIFIVNMYIEPFVLKVLKEKQLL